MAAPRMVSLVAFMMLSSSTPRALAAADGWGASWSFGPVRPTSSNHIIYTKTTLVPGRLPPMTSSTGPLFIWPGLSNPTSDLVQTTADAWQDNASACGAKAGQWCLEASVFGSFGQRSGPSVAIDPDDHITIEYKLGSDNNTWTQTVTSQKLGKVVSTLTSTSGLMLGGGFGFATEADADSYTIDTQYYLCTEIHLAAADPQFGSTGVGAAGAKYGATGTGSGRGTATNLRTPDGGLTWLVDVITLPAMNPQGTQTPVPAYNCTTGGTNGTGGASSTGGASAGGRTSATGGKGGTATGGVGTGGVGSGGRSTAAGGSNPTTGGKANSGGASAAGGSPTTGGLTGAGGTLAMGGRIATGGAMSSGGQPVNGGSPGLGNGGASLESGGTNGVPQTTGGSSSARGGSGMGAQSASTSGNPGTTTVGELPGTSSGCSCTVLGSKHSPRDLAALVFGAMLLQLRRRSRRCQAVQNA